MVGSSDAKLVLGIGSVDDETANKDGELDVTVSANTNEVVWSSEKRQRKRGIRDDNKAKRQQPNTPHTGTIWASGESSLRGVTGEGDRRPDARRPAASEPAALEEVEDASPGTESCS